MTDVEHDDAIPARGHIAMPGRRVTISDVAKAAGVSAMSVSRVLNGRPGVGVETARRIELVAQAMGFRRNRLATNLRRQQQLSLIGMVVPDPYTPMLTSVAVEVDNLVRDRGFIVVTANSGRDVERERGLVTSFVERGFDGILLFTEDDDHGYLAAHLDQGMPIVLIGSPPRGVDAPAVLVDNDLGIRDAVHHLIEHGHRRIGIIASTSSHPSAERLAAYHRALSDNGLDLDPELVRTGPLTPEQGYEAARGLIGAATPPSAIVCTNYLFTAGALRAVREHPRPVALIGFDDFEAASLVDPPITVIAQDTTEMGRRAADLLLAHLAGRGDRTVRELVSPHLIARGSAEFPPDH